MLTVMTTMTMTCADSRELKTLRTFLNKQPKEVLTEMFSMVQFVGFIAIFL